MILNLEEKLKTMGLVVPAAPAPVAAYAPAVRSGDCVYTSGQLPFVQGALKFSGNDCQGCRLKHSLSLLV